MRTALFILAAAAAALAWAVARRKPEHRPIAWALSVYFGASAVRAILLGLAPPNMDPSAPPHVGLVRLAVYADRALFIAWPAALAACAVRVLARRRAWPVAIGYAVAVAALILTYPRTRFDVLRQAYTAIELAALAVGIGAAVSWHRRAWGRERADFSTTIALVLVGGHFATVVAGAYRVGLFGQHWALAQLGYLAILTTVVLLHCGALIWPATSS